MYGYLLIRFVGELNEFLPRDRRQSQIAFHFKDHPSIKDVIESLGVPHPEVGAILVDGDAVGFDYQVKQQEQFEIYPHNQYPDVDNELLLPFAPLVMRFVLDVHLGGLARLLRLAGIDVLFDKKDPGDEKLASLAAEQDRILLTRDRNLLKRSIVRYGYWLRKTGSRNQFQEVVDRYDLRHLFKPFSRCVHCNDFIELVEKTAIADRVQADTLRYYNQFWRCPSCGHIYWQGSHYKRIKAIFA